MSARAAGPSTASCKAAMNKSDVWRFTSEFLDAGVADCGFYARYQSCDVGGKNGSQKSSRDLCRGDKLSQFLERGSLQQNFPGRGFTSRLHEIAPAC